MVKGSIKKIVRDRGFGFIAAEDGRDVFFHRSELLEVDFMDLREGDQVEFDVKQTDRGPNATQVQRVE